MLEFIYVITGVLLIAYAVLTFVDHHNPKRIGTGSFWLIYGLSFCLGSVQPDWVTGLMILAMTLIAASGQMALGSYGEASSRARRAEARRLGNRIFIPAMVVPIGTILWNKLTGTSALIGLGISSVVALLVAILLTGGRARQSVHEGRRLTDAIGWAAILSQFLAALGFLFGQAGVGDTVSQIVESVVPSDSALASVIAYTFGMALFTVIMGNAFAAFAVITAGIGIPLVIVAHGGNPAIVGVLGMLSGYCGTLMTPMAANFNIVPAALLELDDKNLVIKTQLLPGLAILMINTALMYLLAFGG